MLDEIVRAGLILLLLGMVCNLFYFFIIVYDAEDYDNIFYNCSRLCEYKNLTYFSSNEEYPLSCYCLVNETFALEVRLNEKN